MSKNKLNKICDYSLHTLVKIQGFSFEIQLLIYLGTHLKSAWGNLKDRVETMYLHKWNRKMPAIVFSPSEVKSRKIHS